MHAKLVCLWFCLSKLLRREGSVAKYMRKLRVLKSVKKMVLMRKKKRVKKAIM